MLDERKSKILELIIENYTKSAEPVGSSFLVDNCNLELSGATIRNEMRDLEENGYLTHPHTSSGRIPTEKGYRYYVENIMQFKTISKKIAEDFDNVSEEKINDELKTIAKNISEKTGNSVIIAFGPGSLYYTGIKNLFSQPEFHDYSYMVSVTAIFDQCEDMIEDIYKNILKDKPSILIGESNPFGSMCGLVGAKLKNNILFIVLGPVRMDYSTNYTLLDYLIKKF
ncbi:MAG: transcription repressor HrcA [Candidatus Magasanikbacteria bacterium]